MIANEVMLILLASNANDAAMNVCAFSANTIYAYAFSAGSIYANAFSSDTIYANAFSADTIMLMLFRLCYLC